MEGDSESKKRPREYVLTYLKKARSNETPIWGSSLNRLLEEPHTRPKCDSVFANIPEDVFFKICSYLQLQDVWRLGRVCSRWYRMTRSDIVWERSDIVSLKIPPRKAHKLLMRLPTCVRELRIGSRSGSHDKQMMSVPLLYKTLIARFPDLNVLIIENAILSKTLGQFQLLNGFMLNCAVPVEQQVRRYYSLLQYSSTYIDNDFHNLVSVLQDLTVLSLRSSILALEEDVTCEVIRPPPSDIKILDLTHCPCATDRTIKLFCRLPLLQELYVAGTAITVNGVCTILTEVPTLKVLDLDDTVVGGETFTVLRELGQSLVQLYLGSTAVKDSDMIYIDEGHFPVLEKLCLKHTAVSEIGVKKLLLSVQTLKHIFITHSRVRITWVLDQPSFVRSKLKYDDYDESEECNHFLTNTFHGSF